MIKKTILIMSLLAAFLAISHQLQAMQPTSAEEQTWVEKVDEKVSNLRLLDDSIHYQFLEQLSWLIGEWKATLGDMVLISRYSWGENKNYILFDFDIFASGNLINKGREVISWDSDSETIHSWCYSSGSDQAKDIILEERWTRKSNKWIVEVPEPKSGSMRAIYTIKHNFFTWEQQTHITPGVMHKSVEPIDNKKHD